MPETRHKKTIQSIESIVLLVIIVFEFERLEFGGELLRFGEFGEEGICAAAAEDSEGFYGAEIDEFAICVCGVAEIYLLESEVSEAEGFAFFEGLEVAEDCACEEAGACTRIVELPRGNGVAIGVFVETGMQCDFLRILRSLQ